MFLGQTALVRGLNRAVPAAKLRAMRAEAVRRAHTPFNADGIGPSLPTRMPLRVRELLHTTLAEWPVFICTYTHSPFAFYFRETKEPQQLPELEELVNDVRDAFGRNNTRSRRIRTNSICCHGYE